MTNKEMLPSQLPGLDLAATLERTEIPEEVFVMILRKFAKNNKEKAQGMLDVLSHGDLHSLGEMAHTLKGSSATIGASALEQACHALEAAVKEKKTAAEIKSLIRELAFALDTVRVSIATLP